MYKYKSNFSLIINKQRYSIKTLIGISIMLPIYLSTSYIYTKNNKYNINNNDIHKISKKIKDYDENKIKDKLQDVKQILDNWYNVTTIDKIIYPIKYNNKKFKMHLLEYEFLVSKNKIFDRVKYYNVDEINRRLVEINNIINEFMISCIHNIDKKYDYKEIMLFYHEHDILNKLLVINNNKKNNNN